jgi:hypothetical protein
MKGKRVPFQFLTEHDVSSQDSVEHQPLQQQHQQRYVQQHEHAVIEERDTETDSDDHEEEDGEGEGGVFAMTGIGEEVTAQKDKPRNKNIANTLRTRLFATVSLPLKLVLPLVLLPSSLVCLSTYTYYDCTLTMLRSLLSSLPLTIMSPLSPSLHCS